MQLCIRMPITAVFGAFSQDSSGSMAGLDFTLGQGHASPILSMQGYRQAQEEDLETLYDICLQTAWAGGDASGEVFYSDLLGDLFVGPYHASQHSMAEVLCDDDGIVGYLLMTSDTRSFQKWFRMDWLPKMRKKWPASELNKPFTDMDVALWESLGEDQTYHPPLDAPISSSSPSIPFTSVSRSGHGVAVGLASRTNTFTSSMLGCSRERAS